MHHTPMKQLTSSEQFNDLLQKQASFLLFKHSSTCSISGWACKEVFQAIDELESEEVYMLDVLEYADLKYYIQDHTCITHESPQVIIFVWWKVVAYANHWRITKQWILDSMTHIW